MPFNLMCVIQLSSKSQCYLWSLWSGTVNYCAVCQDLLHRGENDAEGKHLYPHSLKVKVLACQQKRG